VEVCLKVEGSRGDSAERKVEMGYRETWYILKSGKVLGLGSSNHMVWLNGNSSR